MDNFERKLMKFWIQSFLLGVPKIIVGFRTRDGVLTKLEEIETASIPITAQRRPSVRWDGNTCINFASAFLECESAFQPPLYLLKKRSDKLTAGFFDSRFRATGRNKR